MPRKAATKEKTTAKKRRSRNAHTIVKWSAQEGRAQTVVEKIESVHGIYTSRNQAEAALRELKAAGLPERDINISPLVPGNLLLRASGAPASDIEPEAHDSREGLGGIAARIAGSALALASSVFAGPVIALHILNVRVPVVLNVIVPEDHHPGNVIAELLLRNGGQNVSLSAEYTLAENEVEAREYRDEQGGVHHHTTTYMRDHAEELTSSAA